MMPQPMAGGMPSDNPMQEMLAQAVMAQAGQPRPGVLGSGAANKAGQVMTDRGAYMQYVTETQSNGGQALPYAEWVKMQQSSPAPMPPAAGT